MWKGASLQERVQMVRNAANLSARELTVEAQRRKKREDRRQKDATQPKQEEAGAQRAAGTAPVEAAMLRAFSQGQQSVVPAHGWVQTGAPQQHMFAPSAQMHGIGQPHTQVPWGVGQDPYAGQYTQPMQAPGQPFGQFQGYQAPLPYSGWPSGYGAPLQQAQMAYTPPQAQGGGQMTAQGGGRPPRQYICFRCGKPGHIAPHCTVNPGNQSSQYGGQERKERQRAGEDEEVQDTEKGSAAKTAKRGRADGEGETGRAGGGKGESGRQKV